MIKPKPKPSPVGSRAMATVVTVALLLGAWVGLKGTAVPAFASGRDVIRELDPLLFQRYAAPAVPEDEAEAETEPEEAPVEEPEVPAEVVSFDEEVGAAMEGLEDRFTSEPLSTPAAERDAGGAGEGAGPAGIAEEVPDARFEALFGGGGDVVVEGAAARRSGRASGDRGGVGLGITEQPSAAGATGVTGAGDRTRSGVAAAGPALDAPTTTRREATAESEVEIGEFEPESFDGSAADRLATWMRRNPADLPVGVRAHVNFQPSFLTSVVPFTSEGREWELFLMFNESLRELHIVLVEGDRSIYMIDRGFQEESRSLREGTVRRVDGEIMAVDSRSVSASGERARDFYNVFLSWWESVSDDVGS